MGLLLRPCCWHSRHTLLLHRACRASAGLAEVLRESTCLVVCPPFTQVLAPYALQYQVEVPCEVSQL